MLRKLSSRFALGLAILLISIGHARAQDVVLSFICDLGGMPAEMTMGVEYQNAFGLSSNPGGDISGIFPVGVTVYTAGQVVSQVAAYSFRGENEYADFTAIGAHERFRVRWVMDQQRNGIWMIVNPFGGATQHFCSFVGAR